MATKPLPAREVLLQLLRYEPDTGKLFWLERTPDMFADGSAASCARWNRNYAGKEAFTCVEPRGYKCGAVFGTALKAHRVIWKMMTGDDPDVIDHANGVRSDNRWRNLSNTDAGGNARNARVRRDNTSGIAGIRRHQRITGFPCWVVTLGNEYLGLHDCIGKAIVARKQAERTNGFHENHGRALR